jgi:hypothetical protein
MRHHFTTPQNRAEARFTIINKWGPDKRGETRFPSLIKTPLRACPLPTAALHVALHYHIIKNTLPPECRAPRCHIAFFPPNPSSLQPAPILNLNPNPNPVLHTKSPPSRAPLAPVCQRSRTSVASVGLCATSALSVYPHPFRQDFPAPSPDFSRISRDFDRTYQDLSRLSGTFPDFFPFRKHTIPNIHQPFRSPPQLPITIYQLPPPRPIASTPLRLDNQALT